MARDDVALPHQAGILVPPHRQHQLPADDCAFHAAHARDDHPFLARPSADAAHRPSAFHGLYDERLQLLLVSQKELFPRTWYKTFLYVPFLMALGVGLTITNTKAVLEALVGHKSAFARTPKYAVQKKGEKSQAKKYRKRLGIIPWIELAIGCYFSWTVWYAVTTENFFTVPFLLLFVLGYWYTGLLSIFQGLFERRGSAGSEIHEKPYPVGI